MRGGRVDQAGGIRRGALDVATTVWAQPPGEYIRLGAPLIK